MRVLMINVVCGIRSTGRICTDLATELEAQGHEVKIAYGREDVPEKYQKYSVRIGSELDTKVHALEARIFDNCGLGSVKATRRFLKWAENYNPDMLWLHNIHGYYINYQLLFAWIKSRPQMQVKWTLHDCWAFTGHCANFLISGCSKWKVHCSQCISLNQYPTCIGIDQSRRNFEVKKKAFTGVNGLEIITPSQWLADLSRSSLLKEYQVAVVYNRIDTTIFRSVSSDFRRQNGIEGKFMILGVASVWSKQKGFEDFLKLAQVIDDRYVIVLVGVNKSQVRHLPSNCIGIQRTNDQRELAAIYSSADCFFNPTYEDNYPTVNLEAKACGAYIYSYDIGGCSETFGNTEGTLLPVGGWQLLWERIRNIA